ncbi:hypothetical protein ABPG75_000771 [Micractinium tetrahymenae]
MCAGCVGALRDGLRGIAVLAALCGLASLLFGLHSLLPLGSTAFDPTVSWFALLLCTTGLVLVLLGGTAGLGFAGPIHCFTGASLALLPLSTLVVWAYAAHSKQLRWLADRDQSYALTAILDWVEGHLQLAAGLAGLWLLLQAAAVLLGALYACVPASAGRRRRHPWDRYWSGEDDGREPLLPRSRGEPGPSGGSAGGCGGSPRGTGYHTPPSRYQASSREGFLASPYQSPMRSVPASGPLVTGFPAPPPVTVTVS